MRIAVILAVISFVMTFQIGTAGEWGVYSEFFDEFYLSLVTDELLQDAPIWRSDNDHPPLPPRKAISAAKQAVDKVFNPEKHANWKMELEEVALRPLGDDRWVWVVRYEGRPKVGGMTGIPPYLDLVVLMDGRVVPLQKKERPSK